MKSLFIDFIDENIGVCSARSIKLKVGLANMKWVNITEGTCADDVVLTAGIAKPLREFECKERTIRRKITEN